MQAQATPAVVDADRGVARAHARIHTDTHNHTLNHIHTHRVEAMMAALMYGVTVLACQSLPTPLSVWKDVSHVCVIMCLLCVRVCVCYV